MPDPDQDLFAVLRDDPHAGGSPSTGPRPSAADVRRRGDALRRRRTAAAVTGAVAAVVLAVGVPVAVAGASGRGGQEPPVAVSSSATPSGDPSTGPSTDPDTLPTTVPEDFPLTTGMPDAAAGGTLRTTTGSADALDFAVDACEPSGLLDSAVASRLATWTDPSEGGEQRLLAVYAGDLDAAHAVDAETDRLLGCADGLATARAGVPADEALLRLGDGYAGTDSVTAVSQVLDGGEGYVVVVVRTGRALLVLSAYSMGLGDPQVAQDLALSMLADAIATIDASVAEYGG
ncbi:hypothetical protein [Nocardioides sp. GY 10127]|uniref:hypothetical protein n=1 Tax=Nocardioides sp. GY 10127 TaxID=2569762 RepID=UPI0014584D15|nr:hypothetical protein [Nocardioides sp. GY 10127]